MTMPNLRIVQVASRKPPDSPTTEWTQLPLFPHEPRRAILCLPMMDLHGATFRRLVSEHKPAAVLDLRSIPYFKLHELNRTIAFEVFASASAVYLHKPLDLRPPADQLARWRVREQAGAIFGGLGNVSGPRPASFAVLIHRHREIAVLAQAVRNAEGTSAPWEMVVPG